MSQSDGGCKLGIIQSISSTHPAHDFTNADRHDRALALVLPSCPALAATKLVAQIENIVGISQYSIAGDVKTLKITLVMRLIAFRMTKRTAFGEIAGREQLQMAKRTKFSTKAILICNEIAVSRIIAAW